MSKKDKDISGYISSNSYAVKMLASISKKRIIFTAIERIIFYSKWVFFSTFFLKGIITYLDEGKDFGFMLRMMGLCAGVLAILHILDSYTKEIIIPQTDAKIYKDLYMKIYTKARNVELRCYDDPDFYSKYTMCMKDTTKRITDSAYALCDILFGGVAAIVAFYAIVSIDVLLSLFLIFPMIGNFYFGKLVNAVYYGREVKNVKNERKAKYINRIMYMAEYAKEMRYSNVHSLMMDKYDDSVNGTVEVMRSLGKRGTIVMAIKNILTFPLPFEGIMIYAVYKTMKAEDMTLAELSIIYSTMAAVSWILIGMFNSITASMENALKIKMIRGFMEYKETIPEDTDGIIPDNVINSIEFKNVSFAYNEKDYAIKNVSFTIKGNSCLALVGHNGSGKSTLINLLLRLYDPTEGEILVNGVNIKSYNLRKYRELFGVAFQDYKVIAMSVQDNIKMGNELDGSTISQALSNAGLSEKIQSLDKKEDTMVTKEFDNNGVVFSEGQKQKLVVARAMAKGCPIKIFDEPSSALDPIAEYDLYNSILSQESEGIMIFISHRLSSVKDADYIFMLKNGELVEQGTHKELIAEDKAYAEIYKMQARNYLALE